tara:strand:+ start:368 stop:859 length:492 start_codon:yes stop_codon:yes gene_type:complete
MSVLKLNYFEIFDIEISITIDMSELDEKYLNLQSKFHPDKFAHASKIEKSMATRISTHINDGYKTLSNLVFRVDYILEINDFSVDENVTFKNNIFLIEQMNLSETITQADESEYSIIKNDIKNKIKHLINEMKKNLLNKDYDELYQNNSMIKFYKKNINQLTN